MVRLSYAISKVIIDEYGQHLFLNRLADPLWFQAFGCVLGFDWHSSGVTTVVTGVLKQSISAGVHGISIAGGKGKKSTKQNMKFHTSQRGITIYLPPKSINSCMLVE